MGGLAVLIGALTGCGAAKPAESMKDVPEEVPEKETTETEGEGREAQ